MFSSKIPILGPFFRIFGVLHRGPISAGMLGLLGQRCWDKIPAKSQHPSIISATSQQMIENQNFGRHMTRYFGQRTQN